MWSIKKEKEKNKTQTNNKTTEKKKKKGRRKKEEGGKKKRRKKKRKKRRALGRCWGRSGGEAHFVKGEGRLGTSNRTGPWTVYIGCLPSTSVRRAQKVKPWLTC